MKSYFPQTATTLSMEFRISSSTLLYLFAIGCFALNAFTGYGSNVPLIPEDEVKILKAITSKIEKLNWNVTPRSCIDGGFKNETINEEKNFIRKVTCNCSFSSGKVCHVTNICMRGLNLSGFFPSEFGYLTHLQELDLFRNSLYGSIPRSFAKLPLVSLDLRGNPITGPIPKEIGEITTLKKLLLEDNLLEGTLPSSLGELKQLRILAFAGNNLSGTIPESSGNLKKLVTFSLGGTNISGKLPNFIGNWTQLKNLYLTGTSMEGPIPTTISQLKNLTILRISDLHGPASMRFPNLENLISLTDLVLRNCSIHDSIPNYIGKMKSLKTLDLSFNKLVGKIPISISDLGSLQYMFLTENSLSGKIPDAILKNGNNYFDLSYNNFSETSTHICQFNNINLASSLSSSANTSPTCLKRGFACEEKPKYHSLFINCGGQGIEYEGNKYEDDTHPEGISFFFTSGDKWAYSSTGAGNISYTNYVVKNIYSLNITGPSFYQTARHSLLSLKYHGLCMINGNYNVKLHFAEIMYSHDQTFTSLGSRIFDVSIQGRKYLRDFNILKEAGGVGKGIFKEFNVDVNDNTLEIHLYFAGKGTYSVPDRDANGPLISAISVTPNFTIPSQRLSTGAIAGIVGVLSDGVVIAVKQLSSKSKQGNREFVNEVGMISALQHPNLVKLYGCCVEGNQLLLIYEYMHNNSLAGALFGGQGRKIPLEWPTRMKICIGIARGLAYLHEESRLKIVHRDIKATNVLLDKDLNAKISDFGLAKLDEDENTHISTRIAGTIGYMAPEYAMRGYLTDKADVYSFGIVALEIVSGKSNASYRPKEEFVYLLDWAYVLQEQGNLIELVDPSLGSNYSSEEAMRMLEVALLCTNSSATLRPSMSSVVCMLEGKLPAQALVIKRKESDQDARFNVFDIQSSQDSRSQTFSSFTKSQQSVEQIVEATDGTSSYENHSQNLASSSFSHGSVE